jgi:hypothetical protein
MGRPGKRPKGTNGKVPAVGDTVDIAKASYTNSIGDPELRTVWTDPEFNRNVRAFYYVRVLEIPTPRWVLFDAIALWRQAAAGHRAEGAGAGLFVADLV